LISQADSTLTQSDFIQPTWLRLEKYLNARITELRELNDHSADAEATADTRGRIAELKLLLALDITKPGNQPPTTPDDGAVGY